MSGWQAVQWVVMLPACWVTLSQCLRYDSDRYTAALQALYPVLVAPVVVVLAISLASGHRLAISAAAAANLLTFAAIAPPLSKPTRRGAFTTSTDAATVRICAANVLASNPTFGATARSIIATKPDVVALAEPTPIFAKAFANVFGNVVANVVERATNASLLPHRIDALADDTTGVAVWSSRPVTGEVVVFERQRWIDATLVVDGRELRIMGAHPYPPTLGARAWRRQLRWLAQHLGDDPRPTVVVGDFNACRWHPSFRRLLRSTRLKAAHEDLGHGWSASWPAHVARRFVRLDHALVRGGVMPTAVEEIDLPGSDHRGFVVTVRVTPPPVR